MKKIFTFSFVCFLLMMGMSDGQTHLWGTCFGGGTLGDGTIFKADVNGNNLTTVYSFDSTNGMFPLGNMVLAPNCKIYGVTYWGGCQDSCVLFEYDPVTHINLDVFDFYCNYNACDPVDGMILGIDGNLYGMTLRGGSNSGGLIYRFNPNTHVFDTLHNFGFLTGSFPYGRLLQLNNKLYGTTNLGGVNNLGEIFCFDLATSAYTDLHDFNDTNGKNPQYGSLILGTDGKLYGTATYGGNNNNGVVFSYDTSANIYSVVHYFDFTHGANPMGSVIQATDGKLYGMTYGGGLDSIGVIFSYDPSSSTYADILDFNGINGDKPLRGIMQAGNGSLYGVTEGGGTNNGGVFFSYNIISSTYNVLFNFDGTNNGASPQCDIVEFIDNCLKSDISQISNKESITIYPNPASTTLILHSQLSILNSQIIITDVLGNEIYHQTINNSTQTTIDVSQWSNGVYFYQIKNDKETLQGKFVKEN